MRGGVGGEAAKTNQKNLVGRRSRPEPDPRVRGDGGGYCTSPATLVRALVACTKVCYNLPQCAKRRYGF
jgi:hypothetical protein